jgi:hypothetical protein
MMRKRLCLIYMGPRMKCLIQPWPVARGLWPVAPGGGRVVAFFLDPRQTRLDLIWIGLEADG